MRHAFLFALALLTPQRGMGQDALQSIKELYSSAAYEDALSSVARMDRSAPDLMEAEQYRVFCLVALGRIDEAEQAVEAVLVQRPEYRPDAAEASPRIRALFSDVRRRIGPAQVKRMYQQARAAMERKDREDAVAKFEAMLRLADDPDLRAEGTVAELKELGSGFLELSRVIPPARSAPVDASTAAPASPRTNVVLPPTVIQQRMPTWVPSSISRASEFQGAIRVQISAEGKVTSAEIVKSIHPAYDQLLLRAAKGWLYHPAQKDGVAVPIDKTVEVKISPQGDKSSSE